MPTATTPKPKNGARKQSRDPEARMTFIGHLAELRSRLIRCAVAALVGFAVCYAFSNAIMEQIARPLRPLQQISTTAPKSADGEGGVNTGEVEESQTGVQAPATAEGAVNTVTYGGIEWISLNPLEPFLVKLKIAAYGGIFLAFPYILYQLCAFIFPGLTAVEKRVVRFLLIGCTGLALAGVAVGYWGVLPFILPYLTQFAPSWVKIQLRLNETLPLVLKGLAAFAIAFQLPMVVMVLVYVGLLTPATLKSYRKVAIVGIFIASAIFTPPDPISMLLLAGPMVLLYEFSIWLSYFVVRRKAKAAAAARDA